MDRIRVEFTIEPFVDGQPGSHVLAAWAAVEALGHRLENGPFAAAVEVDADHAGDLTAAVVGAAITAGASRVSFSVERCVR